MVLDSSALVAIILEEPNHAEILAKIEAAPGIISALYDAGESAIELGSVLGWFGFVVTDVPRAEIKLTGWINRPRQGEVEDGGGKR